MTITPIEIASAGTRWRLMWAKSALTAAKAKVKADLAANPKFKSKSKA